MKIVFYIYAVYWACLLLGLIFFNFEPTKWTSGCAFLMSALGAVLVADNQK